MRPRLGERWRQPTQATRTQSSHTTNIAGFELLRHPPSSPLVYSDVYSTTTQSFPGLAVYRSLDLKVTHCAAFTIITKTMGEPV